MTWTEDRVKQLVQLWTEGKSASQISQELGIVSRNAVIGKIHRLGISTRSSLNERSRNLKCVDSLLPAIIRRKAEKKAVKSKQKTLSPAVNNRTSSANPPDTRIKLSSQSILSSPVLSIIDSKPVVKPFVPAKPVFSIMDLTEKTCKWPIGDPGTQEFHFCGGESEPNSPYCRHHIGMAYHLFKKDKRTTSAPSFASLEKTLSYDRPSVPDRASVSVTDDEITPAPTHAFEKMVDA